MVSITIFALGATSLVARQASIPLLLGIRMSMSTTSGSASPATATASAPSLACPTRSMSSSSSRTISRPRRNRAWSSAISTRIGSGPRPASGRWPAATVESPLALNSLPPSGRRPHPADPGRQTRPRSAQTLCHQTLTDRGPRCKPGGARKARPHRAAMADRELLLDQPDDPVVVAPTAVDHAEPVAFAVVEQVEVMTHEFHLQQGLVDGHRPGRVHLLAQHQGAVPLHLDRDHAAVRFGQVGPVILIVQLTGPRPGRPVAVEGRLGPGGPGLLACGQGGRAQRGVVAVPHLAAVRGPAKPGFEFGEGESERRVPVVRGGLGPDRRAAGQDGQLDALAAIRLPRVAFLGDLHIDPHRLLVKLLELGELGGGMLTETRRDGYVASAHNNFHHDPPSSPIAPNLVAPP